MSPNLTLPDWMPWWGQLVLLILGILFAFAFLMMPFAVFGVKGRLDFLEAQLDDIHAELRMIATRLPEPARPAPREPVFEELARTEPTRVPSPTRTAAQSVPTPVPPPAATAPRQPPMTASPDPVRPPSFTTSPARFPASRAAPAAAPEQLPSYGRDGPVSGDWEADIARRPLRATTLRDPAREIPRDRPREPGRPFERDPWRDPERDPARDTGRDRARSEPVLRWPPR